MFVVGISYLPFKNMIVFLLFKFEIAYDNVLYGFNMEPSLLFESNPEFDMYKLINDIKY